MTTGLAVLDAALGGLVPGALVCMAGRPCVGKTDLLLDAAIRICRRFGTNVVFATAHEYPSEIIERSPLVAKPALMEIPTLDVLRMRNPFPSDGQSKIFVVDIHGVGATWPHVLAHQLQVDHPAGCGLLIADGWSAYPDRGTCIELELAGTRYVVAWERPCLRLSAATLRTGARHAERSSVATIYGIRTAENDKQWLGPTFGDLLHLSSAARVSASETVLVHRPELYLASGPHSEANRGLIELTNAHPNGRHSCRSELWHNKGELGFVSER